MSRTWRCGLVGAWMLASACGPDTGEPEQLAAATAALSGQWVQKVTSVGYDDWPPEESTSKVLSVPGGGWVALYQYGGSANTVGGATLPSTYDSTSGTHRLRAAVVKFQANGTVAWTYSDFSRVGTMTLDSAGNILLAGERLTKLSASGALLWSRPFYPDANVFFEIKAVAPFSNGDFIAAARLRKTNLASYEPQLMLIRYNTQGNVVWSRTWEQANPANNSLQAADVAVDEHGQIYVAGHANGNVAIDHKQFPVGNVIAPFLASFSPSGQVRWLRQLSTFGFGQRASVDTREGHVAVGVYGDCEAPGARGSYLLSYDLSGNRRWAQRLTENPIDYNQEYQLAPFDVQLGPSKEILVASQQFGNSLGVSPKRPADNQQAMLVSKFDRITGTRKETRVLKGAYRKFIPEFEEDQNSGALAIQTNGKVAFGGTVFAGQTIDLDGTNPGPVDRADDFLMTFAP